MWNVNQQRAYVSVQLRLLNEIPKFGGYLTAPCLGNSMFRVVSSSFLPGMCLITGESVNDSILFVGSWCFRCFFQAALFQAAENKALKSAKVTPHRQRLLPFFKMLQSVWLLRSKQRFASSPQPTSPILLGPAGPVLEHGLDRSLHFI